ncbi:transposon Ty3-G Gag-Pol polyprotein [Elysia marginata]|uniref:Transposon Ty3-G Gag-Pol polyprotein n=1 Tax=Elysia marginata TaxID=1093978 RepID=A0AAV4J1W4_9GAST|nr:transposon Ty3-G Gag-Pol polyprotein [Elysia marginata]
MHGLRAPGRRHLMVPSKVRRQSEKMSTTLCQTHTPIQEEPGKRQSGPKVASASAGPHDPQLFLTDLNTGRRFLVDTGAQVSVIPPTWFDRHHGQHGPPLQAANGTSISTYGSRTVSRVAKTELAPIEHDSNKFRKVLQEFPALLQPTFTSSATVKDGVQHHICTTGPPVHSRARRLAPDRLTAAKKEFIEMEQIGIIRKSNSPWASPLIIVAKPNALADATMLSHPKPNAPIALTTDASDQAVGAVLEQYVQGVWQPLAFFSKRLRPPEQKYSTFDRELLGST